MSDRLPVSSALDEETARAEVYGLLAQLWYAPPGTDMLQAIRLAPTEAPAAGAFLEEPWRALVGAAREHDEASLRAEHAALFGGVGKPDVSLFGSQYLTGFLNERPVAQLRDDLRALGLARDEAMPETEDHVAFLCEVMRYLIAGEDVEVANLTRQREFYMRHLQPWATQLCEAVEAHPNAKFYAGLASFTRAFLQVEQQGFDLLD